MRTADRKRGHLLLGVTGGIATGKSAVAEMLREKGALTIDFDLLAREIQEPGQPAYDEIVAFFGNQVLLDYGKLDRKRLSEIVFSDPAKKAILERFTHPRIREAFHRHLHSYTVEHPSAIVQAVIPLLIESQMQHLFDRILLVYAPASLQLRRLMQRDKLLEHKAKRIIDSQLDIEKKRDLAHFIIDNSGELESTRRQVEAVWRRLQTFQEGRDEDRTTVK
jgi:dephospho-CoA kinase